MAITRVTNRVLADNSVGVSQLSSFAVPTKLANDIGSFGFRNKIINGDMRIDQRNDGSALTITPTTAAYCVDRWFGNTVGSNLTLQRVPATAKYVSTALRLTGSTGNTNASVQQRIEASTSASLIGLPVVVSFYAASPSVNTLRIALTRPNAVDNWASATNIQIRDITITSTMTRYEVAFNALPSQAGNGLGVWFLCNNGLGANQTLDITGVQLEEGTFATPFEQRPIGLELSLCQRYYEIIDILPFGVTYKPNGDTRGTNYAFKATKRVAPTFSPSSTTIQVIGFSPFGEGTNLFGTIDYVSTREYIRIANMGNAGNIGNAVGASGVFGWADNTTRTIAADAEL